jgi:hypothetical protein
VVADDLLRFPGEDADRPADRPRSGARELTREYNNKLGVYAETERGWSVGGIRARTVFGPRDNALMPPKLPTRYYTAIIINNNIILRRRRRRPPEAFLFLHNYIHV